MSKLTARTPVLITGSQRSGTTLVNLILNSHPKIWSVDEDKFLFVSIYSYLFAPAPGAPSFVSFKLPAHAHILPFIEMLPGCRLLWCIRDPLDVVFSMMKLRLQLGSIRVPWAVHPGGGWLEINNSYWALSDRQKMDLREHMAEFGKVAKRLVHLQQSPEKLAEVERRDLAFISALCWRIKNELPSLYKAFPIL